MSRTKKPPVGEAWETPPGAEVPDWSAVAAALRRRPGEWLRVYTDGRATWANALSRGRVRVMHSDLGFEFSTTDNQRGNPRTCTLFARWNPDKVDPLSELFAGEK